MNVRYLPHFQTLLIDSVISKLFIPFRKKLNLFIGPCFLFSFFATKNVKHFIQISSLAIMSEQHTQPLCLRLNIIKFALEAFKDFLKRKKWVAAALVHVKETS